MYLFFCWVQFVYLVSDLIILQQIQGEGGGGGCNATGVKTCLKIGIESHGIFWQ